MRRALELAGRHRPHPNPRVGAVALDAMGGIVGEGAHRRPGDAHAEIVALTSASSPVDTLVVTLEPCDHHGLTPPCSEAIIRAGVRRVVVGAVDPDRRVTGRGIERLRAGGVEVVDGVLTDEVESADPAYFFHRRNGRAMITLKSALTLDGQTAAADGSSQWITGEEARADAHLLRSEVDAIMVGAGTVLADDPRLTVRLSGYQGPQPRPVVVLGEREVDDGLRVFSSNPLVYTPRPLGIAADQVVLPDDSGKRVDLAGMCIDLGERGLLDVLIEGGAGLATALWEADLIDRGVTYLGAKLAGGTGLGMFAGRFETLETARAITVESFSRMGPDLKVEWRRVEIA